MAYLGSTLNTVRTFVITTLGLVVAGALALGTVVWLAYELHTGEPVSGADWIGASLFGLLPLVIAVIAFRAAARVRRNGGADEAFPWLARIAPVLVVAGALGGGVVSWTICRDHERSLHESARSLCSRLLHDTAPAEALARCAPIAFGCEREQRRHRDAPTSGMHFVPDFEQRPEVLCTSTQLGTH